MSWDHFTPFAIASLVCWGIGAAAAWRGKRPGLAFGLTGLGLAVFFAFILGMWFSLDRPPMRTMGETRLWYSFFLPLAGIITYARWRYKWILGFSFALSLVFICINLFSPEIHSKTLMPAKPVVRAACDRLHVRLRPVGRRRRHVVLPAVVQAKTCRETRYGGVR